MSVNAVSSKEDYYVQSAKTDAAQEKIDDSIFLESGKETKDSAKCEEESEKKKRKHFFKRL